MLRMGLRKNSWTGAPVRTGGPHVRRGQGGAGAEPARGGGDARARGEGGRRPQDDREQLGDEELHRLFVYAGFLVKKLFVATEGMSDLRDQVELEYLRIEDAGTQHIVLQDELLPLVYRRCRAE